jgi:acetolactate synthase-1/2/3 large subunit
MPGDFFRAGPVFHYAVDLRDASEIATVASKLRAGVARAGGFVAHVGIPSALQCAPAPRSSRPLATAATPAGLTEITAAYWARELSTAPFAIWVGFGARHAVDAVRIFAERTGAPVMCTPRGRGIFPEDHPQFIGVTGLATPSDPAELVAASRAERVLVLGSRLGEFSSLWDARLVPSRGIVHVDVAPEVFGAAYPEATTQGIQADVGEFLQAVSAHLGDAAPRRAVVRRALPAPSVPARRLGPVRPQALMAAVQRLVVQKHGAPILVDCGNGFAWANHCLRFRRPGRFRASVGWGSMGHAAAGVLGTALATGQRCVAIVGDGAMLMQNELSTAAAYDVPAVFIVLNDAQYGMIEQGMRRGHLEPVETQIPRVDFVALARSVGVDGIAVHDELELDAALERAMVRTGPFVVDVDIDRNELAPIAKRVESLETMGIGGMNREQD